MNRKQNELGFLALSSIVISSQIGSGTFLFPAILAPFGIFGLWGWVVSAGGAIVLAFVFAGLSSRLPKHGGPYVYIVNTFGRKVGFFTAWIYWIISWSSNSILLITIANYFAVVTGPLTSWQIVSIEMIVLFSVTAINMFGIRASGILETFLTVLKIVPLLLIALVFFMFFNINNFDMVTHSTEPSLNAISKAALLTSWGFIGFESATTPVAKVQDQKRTLPKAIILGTISVALVYICSAISVTGVVGFDQLIGSSAPYSRAIEKIFGYSCNIFFSIFAIIICIGTLNSWTFTSGQMAYGAAEDRIFPKLFGKVNKNGSPKYALLMIACGIIPFLIVERMYGSKGLDQLLEMVVSIFLFVYIICCLAYIKMVKISQMKMYQKVKAYTLAILGISFCLFVVVHDILGPLIVTLIFIVIGTPMYIAMKKKQQLSCD
jgi:APA family basic amino acid/polyamine antiporter